jgi:hypothetical protein
MFSVLGVVQILDNNFGFSDFIMILWLVFLHSHPKICQGSCTNIQNVIFQITEWIASKLDNSHLSEN